MNSENRTTPTTMIRNIRETYIRPKPIVIQDEDEMEEQDKTNKVTLVKEGKNHKCDILTIIPEESSTHVEDSINFEISAADFIREDNKNEYKVKAPSVNLNTLHTFAKDDDITIDADMEKIINAFDTLKEYHWSELEMMWNGHLHGNGELPNLDLPKRKDAIALIAVDPAPVTFAAVLFSIRDCKVVSYTLRGFRDRGYVRADNGCNTLSNRVLHFVKLLKCKSIIWCCEDQVATRLNELQGHFNMLKPAMKGSTPYNNSKDYSPVLKGESNIVQFVMKGALGFNFYPILPKSVKEYFGFPVVKNGTPQKKKLQYNLNKKSAVDIGREIIPKEMVKDIEREVGYSPDIYDAVIIGKYVILEQIYKKR